MIPHAALTIIEDVNKAHGTTLEDLLGQSRRDYICHARFDAWSRLYARKSPTGARVYSTPRLGDMFGKDTSTVSMGIKRWAELREGVE